MTRRIKLLLKECLPRADSDARELQGQATFFAARFGGKGMASQLGALAWHSARNAAQQAVAGRWAEASEHLSEAFRRSFWSLSIVGTHEPNTGAALLLEAATRGVGTRTLQRTIARSLEERLKVAPDLFLFAQWALRLVTWDGHSDLFKLSPYASDEFDGLAAAPEAIRDHLCDWHLRVACREKDYSPFMFVPHILLPSEVFAWGAKRAQLGLEVPPFDHPLLQTPLARVQMPQIELAPAGHPLIEPLLARCIKDGVLTTEQVATMTDDHGWP